MPYNGVIWFLISLFITNFYFYVIFIVSGKIMPKHQTIAISILCLFMGTCGYLLYVYGINLPLYLDTSLTVLPFFAAGYIIYRKTNLLYIKNNVYFYLFAFFSFAIVVLIPIHPYYGGNCYGDVNLFIIYLVGLVGVLGIIDLCKIIKKLPVVSYFGRYSIIILLTHHIILGPIVHLVDILHQPNELSSVISSLLVCLCYFAIIPLMKKYFPYVVAQKDVIKIKP